jgi:predicted permease
MVLNSLFPVFALVALGVGLKYYRITDEAFLKTADRMVYFIFFPAMLFWKIGGAKTGAGIPWSFCGAALAAVAVTYIVSALALKAFRITAFQAGSFSQSCYRFNTYIGMAIILSALGEAGVRHFGILIGFIIPFINVLAVATLSWYGENTGSGKSRVGLTLKALVSNPLVLGCLSGLIYARFVNTFPVFINNTLGLISMVTLPLALLSIGGSLTLKSLGGYMRPALVAAVIKLVLLPLIGFGFLNLFAVSRLEMQTGMIFFALPTSTALYVLSAQLGSDTRLAAASIVLSTILSFLSLTAVLLIFF